MHIKLNEQNQTIEYPPINKDNICNYNVATDLLEADGYVDIAENLITLFNQGKGKIENNTIIDITDTPEYKLKIFNQNVQYQHDAFNEFSREIVYQIQYNTILGNTTMILNLEEQLQAEQQAVIARINQITEEYNNDNN